MKESLYKSYAELPLFLNAELAANKGKQDKAVAPQAASRRSHPPAVRTVQGVAYMMSRTEEKAENEVKQRLSPPVAGVAGDVFGAIGGIF